jgi:hypothetical protein
LEQCRVLEIQCQQPSLIICEKNLPSPVANKFYFDFGNIGLDKFYTQYEEEVNSVFADASYSSKLFQILKFDGDTHNVTYWQPSFPDAIQMMIGIEN